MSTQVPAQAQSPSPVTVGNIGQEKGTMLLEPIQMAVRNEINNIIPSTSSVTTIVEPLRVNRWRQLFKDVSNIDVNVDQQTSNKISENDGYFFKSIGKYSYYKYENNIVVFDEDNKQYKVIASPLNVFDEWKNEFTTAWDNLKNIVRMPFIGVDADQEVPEFTQNQMISSYPNIIVEHNDLASQIQSKYELQYTPSIDELFTVYGQTKDYHIVNSWR